MSNPDYSIRKKKKMPAVIFSGFGLAAFIILIQLSALFVIFAYLEDFSEWSYLVMQVVDIFTIFLIINTKMDPTSKITWIVVIVIFPVFGIFFLIMARSHLGSRRVLKRIRLNEQKSRHLFGYNKVAEENMRFVSVTAAGTAKYLHRNAGYPVYDGTKVEYFPLGEDKWKAMLTELEKAEKYIFMEYFIIARGEMWGSILDILKRKAAQGVEVFVMYDGTCEIKLLPRKFQKDLESYGIHCKVFSRLKPMFSTQFNYRDHRKILVIDGHTAFNGGVNLGDEYVNIASPFGHWKDTAVMLKGDAVRSFAILFLQMWTSDGDTMDWAPYIKPSPKCEPDGFVVPYANNPLGKKGGLAEQVYMAILYNAKNYVYITTPYLILDGKMLNSVKYCAERGVDIRIIIPGIPDKKIPYDLAKAHYGELLASGVKIYEYTPGFVHAKMFVSDNAVATVGTINLDYRSLYHHFECGTLLCGTSCINDIKDDFMKTLEKCKRVSFENIKKQKKLTKFTAFLAKVMAPMF